MATTLPKELQWLYRDLFLRRLEFERNHPEETRTMCFRIWDLRALSEADVAELKQKLNNIRNREELSPAGKVHPKLDWANVRAHYEDVSYCVEWHDRIWPTE